MYKHKNISVIIPTCNRSEDIKKTLIKLNKSLGDLCEVIIVDQSSNNQTRNLVKSLKSRKIKYLFSNTPSITIARNLGVKRASKSSKIIVFIDDDVDLDKNYFTEILKIFNNFSEARAVAAYVPSPELEKMSLLDILLRKLFFISFPDKEKARILSSYCNTYPSKLNKIINSQWLPGVNMAYKKSVFSEQKFDENILGYTIAEDIDFTFRLYKKYPKSLFITPSAKIIHRVSNVERYPTEKMSFINQIDHFYFNFKNLNKSLSQKLIFIWSIVGITLLRTIKFVSTRKEINYLKLKFYLKSLFYCLRNIKKIKSGRLREF